MPFFNITHASLIQSMRSISVINAYDIRQINQVIIFFSMLNVYAVAPYHKRV